MDDRKLGNRTVRQHLNTIREMYSAVQGENAVAAYFKSKQLLPFGFIKQFRQVIIRTLDNLPTMKEVQFCQVIINERQ